MSEIVEWYAPNLESRTFSCRCGWSGLLQGMPNEYFNELVEYSCPTCDASLVIRSHPTLDEIRAAAANGDAAAIDQLRSLT